VLSGNANQKAGNKSAGSHSQFQVDPRRNAALSQLTAPQDIDGPDC